MALAAGSMVGSHRILGPLGAGGMGQVYRARDTKLGRDVAIKVLSELAARDEPRLRRFEREAHVLASLNHPNIGAVYGLEDAEGTPALVLELVQGPTLAARIAAGPIPLEDALRIARQMAHALDAAHEKGIVHRDLKPANVMLTADGDAKVVDFGLAKELPADSSNGETSGESHAPTLSRSTQPGLIVGTAAYMSPEQARGQSIDKRADVWAFGAVLYEMLTGVRPFQGQTVSDTLAAVLTRDPDWSRLPQQTPAALRRLLGRTLERDAKKRLRDIADALPDLEQDEQVVAAQGPAKGAPSTSRLPRIAALVTATALGALVAFLTARSQDSPQLSFRRITFQRGTVLNARFAHDAAGFYMTASWQGQPPRVYSSSFDAPEPEALEVPPNHVLAGVGPGEILLLQANGTLSRAPLGGGAPRELIENVAAADWAAHGSAQAVVHKVGGRTRLEFPPGTVLLDIVGDINLPRISPARRHVAFVEHPVAGYSTGRISIVDLAGKLVTRSEVHGEVSGLAWRDDDEVWFSALSGASGHSIRALARSGRRRDVLVGAGSLVLHDVAKDGRLLIALEDRRSEMMTLAPGAAQERDLGWLDKPVLEDLTPDGRFVLFHEFGLGGRSLARHGAAYIRGTDGAAPVRVATGTPLAVSPDGKQTLVYREEEGLEIVPTGAGQPRRLPAGTIERYYDASWFLDGRRVLLAANEANRPRRLFVQNVAAGDPMPVTPEGVWNAGNSNPISPDGQWVAAGRTGSSWERHRVEGGDPLPIPGILPGEVVLRWSADGRHLFVVDPDGRSLPVAVVRIDIANGRRELWKQLAPPDRVGVVGIRWVLLTLDGRSYAYSYSRTLSELYLVSGVR